MAAVVEGDRMSFRPWPIVAVGRFFGVDSWRALAWVSAGAAMVIALFLIQYATFGTARYLGWDTSYYVQQAREIQVRGPAAMLFEYYHSPAVYRFLLWAVGSLAGNIAVGERIFPAAMGMILVGLYYRFGRELFRDGDRDYAGVVALLAAVSSNTMRLMSDLHRNLFALIAAFAFLLVLAEVVDGKRSRKSGFFWLLVMGALVAYSHIETSVVLLLVVTAYSLVERRIRWLAPGAAVLPLVAAAPLMIPFYYGYVRRASIPDPADPAFVLGDVIAAHGGALPLLFLAGGGVAIVAMRASRGETTPRLLLLWYVVLLELMVLLLNVRSQLSAYRPLYLIPVPILLTLGVREFIRLLSRGRSVIRSRFANRGNLREHPVTAARVVLAFAIVSLVVFGTSASMWGLKDDVMQPHISEERYVELVEIGRALERYSSSNPILVFYGTNSTRFYSIDRSYVGSLSGPVLGYFGRPQYLLSLTDPQIAEPLLSDDPVPSRFVAGSLYQELKGAVPSASEIVSHPIVISTSGLYARPVSDYFVVRHRVAPGLYVVPPGGSGAVDLSTWMWFAAFDWRVASPFCKRPYSWAVSPQVLEYATPSLPERWSVDYFMDLREGMSNSTLSFHVQDSPPFPREWNVEPGNETGFTVYVDDVPVAHYAYADQGARWVHVSLGPLGAGGHIVKFQAEELGKPFSIALDALAIYSDSMDLTTLLSAYDP